MTQDLQIVLPWLSVCIQELTKPKGSGHLLELFSWWGKSDEAAWVMSICMSVVAVKRPNVYVVFGLSPGRWM